MAYFRRKNGSVYVYKYDSAVGAPRPMPRSETRHLDGHNDAFIDYWIQKYVDQKPTGVDRSVVIPTMSFGQSFHVHLTTHSDNGTKQPKKRHSRASHLKTCGGHRYTGWVTTLNCQLQPSRTMHGIRISGPRVCMSGGGLTSMWLRVRVSWIWMLDEYSRSCSIS